MALRDFRADAVSGLTVAIVALPLSMAIAIASGVTPERGLYTAIVGGFLVSLLGGSRFQIGGPAGAFIVLVALTVDRHGLDGLLLATLMAGIILVVAGFLRLGTYIKFIPYPVTVGFTAGHRRHHLRQPDPRPGRAHAGRQGAGRDHCQARRRSPALIDTFNPFAVGLALSSASPSSPPLRKLRPHWPGMLIAVVLASRRGLGLRLPVETIGSRFGGIPASCPAPQLPRVLARESAGRAARRDCLRAAGRHRSRCSRPWWPTA